MTEEIGDDRPKIADIAVPMGVVATFAALLMLASAGFGYQMDLWSFMTGFTILGVSAWLGLGAAVVSLVGAYFARTLPSRGRMSIAIGAAILAVAVAVVPWQWNQTVYKLPFIHDISTNTDDPPLFVALLAARAESPNTSDYGGAEVAAQQKAAYPDIQPVILDLSADEGFRRAEAAVRSLGWDVVALITTEGRIEATDTTFWFGFKDDIVVRVRPIEGEPGRSRIDARSVSRVGLSDIGANANRLRAFTALLTD
jgi:uncharacterized protein (DUF1499 family)